MPPVPALPLPRRVTPEPVNVAPGLVGQPLATPQRRALAMAVDLLVVALLSGVASGWLAAGLLLVALQLRSERGGGPGWRDRVGWMLAALLVVLALHDAWKTWERHAAPRPAAVAAAASAPGADDDDEDIAIVKTLPGVSDAQRIKILEAELKAARKESHDFSLRDELDRLADSAGASFGWGVVYFSLLPAWWGGQTLGKKLMRLRVVELTGRPLTVLRCLRRYGGYAAGLATGGLGFAQLIWDPNRQAIQDRCAHTVVVDLRAEPAPEAPA